jgi:hypothetical protein
MTRETKLGMVVSGAFLILVGTAVARAWLWGEQPPGPDTGDSLQAQVVPAEEPGGEPEPGKAAPDKPAPAGTAPGLFQAKGDVVPVSGQTLAIPGSGRPLPTGPAAELPVPIPSDNNPAVPVPAAAPVAQAASDGPHEITPPVPPDDPGPAAVSEPGAVNPGTEFAQLKQSKGADVLGQGLPPVPEGPTAVPPPTGPVSTPPAAAAKPGDNPAPKAPDPTEKMLQEQKARAEKENKAVVATPVPAVPTPAAPVPSIPDGPVPVPNSAEQPVVKEVLPPGGLPEPAKNEVPVATVPVTDANPKQPGPGAGVPMPKTPEGITGPVTVPSVPVPQPSTEIAKGTQPPNDHVPPVGAPPTAGSPQIKVPGPLDGGSGGQVPVVTQDYYAQDKEITRDLNTLEAVSQQEYFTQKYARALLLYNRDMRMGDAYRDEAPRLQVGQKVKIPPAWVLEQRYPNEIRNNPPAAPLAPANTGAPIASTVPAAGTNTGAPAKQPVATGTKTYTVRGPNERLYEIARQVLGNGMDWPEIYRLNIDLNIEPQNAVPVGTVLRLPASARVGS